MTKEEYLKLIEEITLHNNRYYIESNPVISDEEYDILVQQLKEYENENPENKDPNSPTNKLIIDNSSIFEKIKHDHPMLSLDNTYNMKDMEDFDKRINKHYKTSNNFSKYCVELKIDGVSISIKYKNKKLYKAVTRGDGVFGEDITHNVIHMSNIPKTLEDVYDVNIPNDFEVRGEIYLPFENFNEINKEKESNKEKLYANPRNLCSGILRRKVPNKKQLKMLSYFMYEISTKIPEKIKTQDGCLKILKGLGFNTESNTKLIQNMDDLKNIIDYFQTEKENLDYPIDGLVIKLNDFNYKDIIGSTNHHPNWAVAYKFKTTKKYTKLISVTTQVGKTGIITPVAELEPIELEGTVVKRASLHNYDIVKKLGIMIGDYVEVQKAAEIIPQVIGFDSSKRNDDVVSKIKPPKKCPCCGGEVGKGNSDVYLYCLNEKCPAKIKGMIIYWASKKAMDITGLGDTIIEKLVDKKIVKNIVDLYKLNNDKLMQIDRMGDKLAENILESIEKSKEQPFEKVLCGLGIPNVGRTISKILCKKYKDLRELIDATYNELIGIEDIGPIVAKEIIEYFKKDENIDMLNELDELGLKFENDGKNTMETKENKNNSLNGKVFCITGTLSNPRNYFNNLIIVNGGEVVSSITNKTTHLLYGKDCGSKLDKAKNKNVTLVSENELFEMIKI